MQVRPSAHSGHRHCSLPGMGCLFVVIDFTSRCIFRLSQPTCHGQNCYCRHTSNILGTLRCTKSPLDILCLCDFPLLLLATICTAWSSRPCAAIQVLRQTRLFHGQSPVPLGYRNSCAPMYGCASSPVHHTMTLI
jgi:hypothetical protein